MSITTILSGLLQCDLKYLRTEIFMHTTLPYNLLPVVLNQQNKR